MMNKLAFFKCLKDECSHLKPGELDDILLDYEQHFEAAMLNGETEEEIINKLGDPKEIAKEFLESSKPLLTEKHSKKSNFPTFIIFLIFTFFNITIGIPLLFSIVLLILSFAMVGLILLIIPIIYAVAIFWQGFSMFEISLSLVLSPLGYFLLRFLWHGRHLFHLILKHYIIFNTNLAKGEIQITKLNINRLSNVFTDNFAILSKQPKETPIFFIIMLIIGIIGLIISFLFFNPMHPSLSRIS